MGKNVGLGISLKNSVCSKEFITNVNALGHCISYDDLLRIDTTWASSIVKSDNGYITLPNNIKPGLFVQAASDNADYSQDNNSQHLTNTVLYQYGNFQCGAMNKTPISKAKSKLRRSLPTPETPLEEFRGISKPRLPQYLSVNPYTLLSSSTSGERLHSTYLDMGMDLFTLYWY